MQETLSTQTFIEQVRISNTVKVHIWTSGSNPRLPGRNVGHAAIELSDTYISVWPKQGHFEWDEVNHRLIQLDNTNSSKTTEGKGIISPITHQPLEEMSYEVDCAFEDRPPEYTAIFYSLDVNALKDRYEIMKRSLTGWTLLSGFGLTDSKSCAGAVWQLLMVAGLGELISLKDQIGVSFTGVSKGSSISMKGSGQSDLYQITGGSFYIAEHSVHALVPSPDVLARLLQRAEEEEKRQREERGEKSRGRIKEFMHSHPIASGLLSVGFFSAAGAGAYYLYRNGYFKGPISEENTTVLNDTQLSSTN